MLLILCLLLATTTSMFGLLALWAASSPRHWFLRTVGVGGVLSLLLFIPAYELFVCFGIQAALVAAVFAVRRVMARRKERIAARTSDVGARPSDASRRSFSLQTMLLATVVLAALLGVGIYLPTLEWLAWVIVVGMGAQAAIQTLAAAWLVFGKTRRWMRILLAGLIPVTSLVVLLRVFDALVEWSTTTIAGFYFPPQPFGEKVGLLLNQNSIGAFLSLGSASAGGLHEAWPWWVATLIVSLAVVALTAALMALIAAAFLIHQSQNTRGGTWPRRQRALCAGAFGSLVLVAALPAWVYWQILYATPIPVVKLPTPNGYDALVEATGLLNSAILNDPDTAPLTALRTEVAKHQRVYELAELGLARECVKPVRYDQADVSDALMAMRSLARAIVGAGHVAKADKNFGEAGRHYSNVARLGPATARGGLLVDGLVGIAIEGIGQGQIRKVSAELSNTSCREAIKALVDVDQAWEHVDEFIRRDRIWSEHAMGWQGRLEFALQKLSGDEDTEVEKKSIDAAFRRNQATRRLLMTNLALRAYQIDQGHLPEALTELVPTYFPAVPRDPYADGNLTYRCDGETFLLYSVGRDGVDDGGQRLTFQEFLESKAGDMFFETIYEEDASTAGRTMTDAENKTE